MVAPASAVTEIPGLASGRMTTTVHDPEVGFHVTVWVPLPDAHAAQMGRSPGGTNGPIPPRWA